MACYDECKLNGIQCKHSGTWRRFSLSTSYRPLRRHKRGLWNPPQRKCWLIHRDWCIWKMDWPNSFKRIPIVYIKWQTTTVWIICYFTKTIYVNFAIFPNSRKYNFTQSHDITWHPNNVSKIKDRHCLAYYFGGKCSKYQRIMLINNRVILNKRLLIAKQNGVKWFWRFSTF